VLDTVVRREPIDQMLEVTEWHKTQQLRENRLARFMASPRLPRNWQRYGTKTAFDFKSSGSDITPKPASMLGYSQVTSKSTGQMWVAGRERISVAGGELQRFSSRTPWLLGVRRNEIVVESTVWMEPDKVRHPVA